jgi:hypothetical protein
MVLQILFNIRNNAINYPCMLQVEKRGKEIIQAIKRQSEDYQAGNSNQKIYQFSLGLFLC